MKTVKLSLTDTFLRNEKLAILQIPRKEKYYVVQDKVQTDNLFSGGDAGGRMVS